MKSAIVAEEKNKPVLDEQTLDKLLEAAYVLQEHNRELRELERRLQLKRDALEAEDRAAAASESPNTSSSPANAQPDYTQTLGKIVETQHQIQIRKLSPENSMSLVAERVIEISGCGGAAVAMVSGPDVRYRPVAGLRTLAAGTVIPIDKALCDPCIKTGQVLRCADVDSASLLDSEECRRRGIQSLIAAPVFHNGEVAGALELYYSAPHAFTEQDVHTCQLMAGLVTEALVRNEEQAWKKSLATERAALLEALEKLQPNLAALVEKPASKDESPAVATTPVPETVHSCRKCGHKLLKEEMFCGECGTPRTGDYEPPSMQSKVASLWQIQEELKKETAEAVAEEEAAGRKSQEESDRLHFETALSDALGEKPPQVLADADVPLSQTSGPKEFADLLDSGDEDAADHEVPPVPEESRHSDTAAVQKLTVPANWSSAASARAFLEQLASAKRPRSLVRFWNTRRGDIYLGIAVILVACVIRWGFWSSHSASATGAPNAAVTAHRKPTPDAGLSLFDRMLIQLGLAEAPDTATEDKGNPSVQVWVDERTALYYCPGTDLYGKTPKGKFATQREAQLDQFEPAYRKACN